MMATTEERLVRLSPREIAKRDRVRERLAERLFKAHQTVQLLEGDLRAADFRNWRQLTPAESQPYRFAARAILSGQVG